MAIDIQLRNNHLLRITPGDYGMEFELVEKVGINGKDDERVRIKGFLKWDGCMNWSTSDHLMYHFCEEDDADLVNEAFKKLWEIGPEHIEHWMD
jgi:hypothetical protein